MCPLCFPACDESCKTCTGPSNRDCDQCAVGWAQEDGACVGEAGWDPQGGLAPLLSASLSSLLPPLSLLPFLSSCSPSSSLLLPLSLLSLLFLSFSPSLSLPQVEAGKLRHRPTLGLGSHAGAHSRRSVCVVRPLRRGKETRLPNAHTQWARFRPWASAAPVPAIPVCPAWWARVFLPHPWL